MSIGQLWKVYQRQEPVTSTLLAIAVVINAAACILGIFVGHWSDAFTSGALTVSLVWICCLQCTVTDLTLQWLGKSSRR